MVMLWFDVQFADLLQPIYSSGQNPFASTHSLDANPFEDPFTEPQTVPYGQSADAARMEQLSQRERDLERREQELNQRAETLRKGGRNNWPPCSLFAMIHAAL